MRGLGHGLERHLQHLERHPYQLVARAIEVFDHGANSVGVRGVDGPPGSMGADALAERAVARADHGDPRRHCLAHHDPERLCVRAREQHDLDAGPVEQVGKRLVVVLPVRVQLRRRRLLERAEVVDLDVGVSERLGQLVDGVEAFLRPAEADERDPQRLVPEQPLVGLVGPAAEPDHRTVVDELHPVGVGLVHAEEIVGRALAREHPVIDRIQLRSGDRAEVVEIVDRDVRYERRPGHRRNRDVLEAPLARREVLGDAAGVGLLVEQREVGTREEEIVHGADHRARELAQRVER